MANPIQVQSDESRASKTVREVFESGRPLTYIRSSEEMRVGKVLREVAGRIGGAEPLPVWTWSLTEGLHLDGDVAEPGTLSPRAALDRIAASTDGAIFHLKDFHEPLRESAEIRRRLRDLYEISLDHRKFIVISSPVHYIPEELERSILYLDLRPPDVVELVQFMRDELKALPGRSQDTEEAVLYPLARALQGLTLDEARYALRRALASGNRLGPESMPALLEEKRLLVNRTGFIEFISEGNDHG